MSLRSFNCAVRCLVEFKSDMKFPCPVCNFLGLDEAPKYPYGTHEICECCGIQFGLEVQKDSDILRERNEWLASGAPWFDDVTKPVDWSVKKAREQLEITTPNKGHQN